MQQKGIDLVLETLPGLMHRPLQLVILGTGEAGYEAGVAAHRGRDIPDAWRYISVMTSAWRI